MACGIARKEKHHTEKGSEKELFLIAPKASERIDIHKGDSKIKPMKRQMILPLTEEVDKGSISFWYASEGEEVEAGKPLVEVITEKTSFTVESPWTGRLVKIYAEEGAEISKGEVVADIEETEIS